MRFRTVLTYLSLLPLSACTKSCNEYDNNEEFARAQLPAYTETGAGTLGCRLGPQVWTVLGSHYQNRIGYPWLANGLEIDGRYAVPPYVTITGRMTGVRDSKEFYDMGINISVWPTDTLGGLHLLGADTARQYTGRFVEQMSATDMMTLNDYHSSNRRPVRLLVRKLDRQQRIISGTFEGMLYQQQGPDSLAVADGRFDVKY
jgi:hypothetical protein